VYEILRKEKLKSKIKTITIGDYIDIYQILESQKDMSAENRRFALKNKSLINSPLKLINMWRDYNIHLLPYPPNSANIIKILTRATLFSFIISFLMGTFTGTALLHYNGNQPINLLYFFAMVSIFPIITMGFTISAMFVADKSHSVIVHLSPAYWLEYLMSYLPSKYKNSISKLRLNPLIGNWIIIHRSQFIALIFSLGLFLTLLVSVASSDIAFSWSTTLHITSEELHSFFYTISYPWREIIPSAVPSLELIEKSHYFRLGGKLNKDIIENALLLGEWWKFLAMSALTYSIILRAILLFIVSRGLQRALNNSTLNISRDVLKDMREPFITSQSQTKDKPLIENSDGIVDEVDNLKEEYPIAIGWALDRDTISEYNKKEDILVDEIYEVGGRKLLEEDKEVIDKAHGDILFYIKSWQPPTMDFIDFIEGLSHKDVKSIEIYLIGIKEYLYKCTDADFEIWERKLSLLNDKKVRIKR